MENKKKIAIIGLGYVGLPLAINLDKHHTVTGFDINKYKVDLLKNGHSTIDDISKSELTKSNVIFSTSERILENQDIYIITVPTPVFKDNKPDLSHLKHASKLVGKYLSIGNIVVYESTVFPGATEEICLPILEKHSNLKHNTDFFIGYSPERVNPSDKINTMDKITKIVSASTPESAAYISKIYSSFIKSEMHIAPNIMIAETAKIVENAQRDVNIAFINEITMICNKLNIDTEEVLKACRTKWNFLDFKPGLVGGHCISVDPYYLINKSEENDIIPHVMNASRLVNNSFAKHISNIIIKKIISAEINLKEINVGILGVTFKEDCNDIRNTKVIDIINELHTFGLNPQVFDPIANRKDFHHEYGIQLLDNIPQNLDVLILAVPHKFFKEAFKNYSKLSLLFSNKQTKKVLIDLKSAIEDDILNNTNIIYWRP